MQKIQDITVIGSGSWATALVKIFAESEINVRWHIRSQEQVDYLLLTGQNLKYLRGVTLNMNYIHPTCKIEEAIAGSANILFAVPSAYLESAVEEIDENTIQPKRIFVSIKGIVPDLMQIPSMYLSRRFNKMKNEITILAGPCHAEEICLERKTFLTISGKDESAVSLMKNSIQSHYLHVITNKDPVGVEYASILKNIIGIGSGIVRGLNYGDNFLSVVVSNAMREIRNFLHSIDQFDRDLYDSVYFGDLLVTAYSEFSRNRAFGTMVGRGYSVSLAESRMTMVVEGLPAVKAIYQSANLLGIKMPVLSTVYRILYKQASPFIEFKLLESHLK